jgi:hypothetical protein
VYGHPPSTVFDRPAPKFIEVDTLDPPAGHNAPEQGHVYVGGGDGTPAIKRNLLSFTPPATADATGTEAGTGGCGRSKLR